MKNFLLYTLATITGIILASIIFFVFMIASLTALVASGDKPVTINEKSILVLKGGVPVPDRGTGTMVSGDCAPVCTVMTDEPWAMTVPPAFFAFTVMVHGPKARPGMTMLVSVVALLKLFEAGPEPEMS